MDENNEHKDNSDINQSLRVENTSNLSSNNRKQILQQLISPILDNVKGVKTCLIESIRPFLKRSPEYENILLNISHDKVSIFSLKDASF